MTRNTCIRDMRHGARILAAHSAVYVAGDPPQQSGSSASRLAPHARRPLGWAGLHAPSNALSAQSDTPASDFLRDVHSIHNRAEKEEPMTDRARHLLTIIRHYPPEMAAEIIDQLLAMDEEEAAS